MEKILTTLAFFLAPIYVYLGYREFKGSKKGIIGFLFFILIGLGGTGLILKNQNDITAWLNNENSSKYVGIHNGRWEGLLLNETNSGNAEFEVKSNGNATLSMTGKFNATHTGKVKGDKFITDKNQTCKIVDLGGGNFKVVLIWTGVNVDVMF